MKIPLLWIRNDLFRIQPRIFRVPDPDPSIVDYLSKFGNYLKKNTRYQSKRRIYGTNYLQFSISHYNPTVQNLLFILAGSGSTTLEKHTLFHRLSTESIFKKHNILISF